MRPLNSCTFFCFRRNSHSSQSQKKAKSKKHESLANVSQPNAEAVFSRRRARAGEKVQVKAIILEIFGFYFQLMIICRFGCKVNSGAHLSLKVVVLGSINIWQFLIGAFIQANIIGSSPSHFPFLDEGDFDRIRSLSIQPQHVQISNNVLVSFVSQFHIFPLIQKLITLSDYM